MDEYEELSGYGDEIVGEDELIGDVVDEVLDELSGIDDDEEDVGAVKRKLKKRIKRKWMPKVRKAIRKVRNTQFRNYPIGLGIVPVPAAATVTTNLAPQLPFKPNRLSIPATISAGLVIVDVQVGTASQFAGPGEIPVECFDVTATDVRLKGDTAVPGVVIQITVRNPTAGALNLEGMVLGDVAQ
jgi:hypothetical protein